MSPDDCSCISLSTIPKLHNSATFPSWKHAVEVQLLLSGCIGIVEGNDREPYRNSSGVRVRVGRAGSVPPSAAESETNDELTADQRRAWDAWRRREWKVQGVIRGTVGNGMLLDILEMNSAKEMWDYIVDYHRRLDSLEVLSHVDDALRTLRLKEDPSAEQMESHLEDFYTLLWQARIRNADFTLSDQDRTQKFLTTIKWGLGEFWIHYSPPNDPEDSWLDLVRQYNLETADRRRTNGQSTANARHNTTRPRKDKSIEQCRKCNQIGHFARNCRWP